MFVSKEFINLKHEKILSHDVAYQGDFFSNHEFCKLKFLQR